MSEEYVLKTLNTDYKLAAILAPIMAACGGLLLLGGWREITIGIFFILGGIILIGVSIHRKITLNKKLVEYLENKLKRYFSFSSSQLIFKLEKRKKFKYSYYIYVNGYVNKANFEVFMKKIKEEIGINFEHRLLRKPARSIKVKEGG